MMACDSWFDMISNDIDVGNTIPDGEYDSMPFYDRRCLWLRRGGDICNVGLLRATQRKVHDDDKIVKVGT